MATRKTHKPSLVLPRAIQRLIFKRLRELLDPTTERGKAIANRDLVAAIQSAGSLHRSAVLEKTYELRAMQLGREDDKPDWAVIVKAAEERAEQRKAELAGVGTW
jgi:hypothetical protein